MFQISDNVLINSGTSVAIASDEVGTVQYQVVKLDVGAGGTTAAFTGTIAAVTNLASGTLATLGTVGVLNGGTVNNIPIPNLNSFSAVVNIGTSTMGTLKALVSGSAIYITDLVISAGTVATNVVLGDGGTANPLLGTLFFAANGGMVSNFKNPPHTTAGSALVYKQSGNVDLSITVSGYVA